MTTVALALGKSTLLKACSATLKGWPCKLNSELHPKKPQPHKPGFFIERYI